MSSPMHTILALFGPVLNHRPSPSGMYSRIIFLRLAKSIVQSCPLCTQHSIFGIYAPVLDFHVPSRSYSFPKILGTLFYSLYATLPAFLFHFITTPDTDSGASGVLHVNLSEA